jgi:hypothetical protein
LGAEYQKFAEEMTDDVFSVELVNKSELEKVMNEFEAKWVFECIIRISEVN